MNMKTNLVKKMIGQKNTSLVQRILITVYILVVLAFSATAKAEMRLFPIVNNDNQQAQVKGYVGEIAMTVDGIAYLIVSETEFYQLEANIDLNEYNGQNVQVIGYEYKYKVGPVVETASMDPLPSSGDEATEAPLLIVFGISEIQ